MAVASFVSARQKIERAEFHMRELRQIVEDYEKRPIDLEPLPEGISYSVIRRGFPPSLRLCLGDVVHNLRSALDHTAVALVDRNGKPTKGVAFPFADAEANLRKRMKERNFHKASEKAIDTMLNLPILPVGDTILASINALDIVDKHYGIHPIGMPMAFKFMRYPPNLPKLASEIPETFGKFYPDEGFKELGRRYKITDGSIQLKFDQDSAMKDYSIIDGTTKMVEVTTDVVSRFAALYGE